MSRSLPADSQARLLYILPRLLLSRVATNCMLSQEFVLMDKSQTQKRKNKKKASAAMSYMNIKYGMLTILQPKIVNYLIPAVMFQDIKGNI